MHTRTVLGLVGWLALCFGVAALGGIATDTGAWYQELTRPAWNPPGWVFGPVWTLLYTLMAVAAWGIWKETGFREAAVPLALFGVQLALNGLWSWLFFGWQLPGWAFAEILMLWTAIAATLLVFYRVKAWTAYLLVPYLLWVSYAAALNGWIWWMN
ncbi:MAG: tryptophan-rich sensory protein [Bacteroidetes bacterium]|jgi:tryptophan-rich sensory protein|nr:tryptophan-rich sensory protein [Bacteroidota bacterium]